jgi:UDP-N-acetylglucosamine diphosphorylase/glucosamine-1-phosphate N-acetyltransferase
MNIILFDDSQIRTQLLPFTFTRPIALIRCGIMTIAEKWEANGENSVSFSTVDYLSAKFTAQPNNDNFFIDGSILPDEELTNTIRKIPIGTSLVDMENRLIAARSSQDKLPSQSERTFTYTGVVNRIEHPWHIFQKNAQQIIADFTLLTKGRKSNILTDAATILYSPENIFIEEGAQIKAAVLNAEKGPIYIGKNAQIQEGALIQGPFALGTNSVVAQGSKIRPNSSIGPSCKVGGELNNVVFFANSNKGHDGYLGNAVIGEWCNLGANTNNSNLKNDLSEVKIYSYVTQKLEGCGLIFCGLFMGDYSKAGISTMFNTGTVVGIAVNVFGAGFQAKHIPSFTWGGQTEGYTTYRLDKAIEVIRNTQAQKNINFTLQDDCIIKKIHQLTTI